MSKPLYPYAIAADDLFAFASELYADTHTAPTIISTSASYAPTDEKPWLMIGLTAPQVARLAFLTDALGQFGLASAGRTPAAVARESSIAEVLAEARTYDDNN